MHRWCHILGSWLLLPAWLLGFSIALPTMIDTPEPDMRETYHWSMQYATDWEENGTFDSCEFITFLSGKIIYYTDRSENPYRPWICETYFTGPALERAKNETYQDDLNYEGVLVRVDFADRHFATYEERDEYLAEYCAIHAPEAELIPAIGLLRFENITFFQLRTLWKTFEGEKVRIFIAEEWEYESKFHRTLEEAQQLIREGKLAPDGFSLRE